MKLVIVESPTKAKTISRFLGKEFRIESSFGHIRDLPSSSLGVDTENNFTPKYVTPRKNSKTLKNLKEAVKKSDEIILASDEDREGEAIAWHLVKALKLDETKKIERIVFHEITKKAIEEAVKNPRQINMNLVDAQQARRVLDRLVGYKLSPFLWKKLMRGLSAGRVQSVALRLIVEREREREAFKPEEYWTIEADLSKEQTSFKASLIKIKDKTLDKFAIKTEADAKKITDALTNNRWTVDAIEKKAVSRTPNPPFITSTIQQEASKRLRFSAKQTMLIAQQLYEGIEVEGKSIGLITYMRTDSVNLSSESINSTREFIKEKLGKEYLLDKARIFKTKSKRAQEAHEAIRPTDVTRTPDSLKEYLNKNQFVLYELIWQRLVASQMPNAIFDSTTVDILTNEHVFRSSGQIMKFDGFLKIWPMKTEEVILPNLIKDDELELEKLEPLQHFTQPPARFSEAALIKTLEQYGIGRPSTYAPTISNIEERGYVIRDEKKKFVPSDIGKTVNDMLVENFQNIVDIQFTAKMEEEFDDIASGNRPWTSVIEEFYGPFAKNLEEKFESVEKRDFTEPTDEICENCGKPMVIKRGRFGKFIACSGFPDCKTTKRLPDPDLENMKCPKCEEGDVVRRRSKRGRFFFGCSRWPDCDFASWKKPEIPQNNGD
ncbi:type I DNA topoisomerase [Patescibacteria group bacterium]